jgi:hypothetical protein
MQRARRTRSEDDDDDDDDDDDVDAMTTTHAAMNARAFASRAHVRHVARHDHSCTDCGEPQGLSLGTHERE